MTEAPAYRHVQRGIIRPILLVSAAACAGAAWLLRDTPALWIDVAAAVVLLLASFAFGTLTVEDEGRALAVRFGPLPLFRKRIPYASIARVERMRSAFLFGWGIHYTPKGWLWNIGGFDCVAIGQGAKTTLVGTDDPEGLADFLMRKSADPEPGRERVQRPPLGA
jgi:hypothetical protein